MTIWRRGATVVVLAALALVAGACALGGSSEAHNEAMSPAFQPAESLHVGPKNSGVEHLTEPAPPPGFSAEALTNQLAATMDTTPNTDNFASGVCHGDRDLHIHLQGADGSAVTAQISADFKRGSTKIGQDGDPIPSDQYSRLMFLNGADGTKDTCLTDVPDAEVYVEVYPKDYVDGAFALSSGKYGSVMWHGVWAGPGQTVSLTMPLACDAGGGSRGTGAIAFTATVDGKDVSLSRLVAWSRASGSSRTTPGFAVADSSQLHTPDVQRLDRLAPDQPYFVQMQTADGHIMSYEPVKVSSCKDTTVAIAKSGNSCVVTIDGGDGKPCTLLDDTVG
jgi:hypothetical protein